MMICVCGDPRDAHKHGVCTASGCFYSMRQFFSEAFTPEHCVSFQIARFKSPQQAHEFWRNTTHHDDCVYLVLWDGIEFALDTEPGDIDPGILGVTGFRVGQINQGLLILNDSAAVKKYLNFSSSE